MGFIATLLLSVIFGIIGVVRPRLAVYLILGLFVFFDELGPGFTTYRGSFVFNAYFVGFYGLRLVEVLTVSAYIPMLVMTRDRSQASRPFRAERAISLLFFAWIAILVGVGFSITGKVAYSDWRLIVTGAMQFHMFVLMFRDEASVKRLVQVLLIMLAIKATYGLGMYAAGFGAMTFRGRLPFFWDSRQVEAFGLGVVMLTAYLLNHASLGDKNRILPFTLALVMWSILLLSVVGSIRRTIWVSTFVGMLAVMLLSKRTTVLHYFAIVFAGSIAVASVLLVPGLDGFRDHMGKYVQSLNLLDERQLFGNQANAVHVANVDAYYNMVTEKTDILGFGLHGPSGSQQYELLMEQYSEGGKLGMAHNGILRSVLFFGIFGALLYIAFFAVSIVRTLKIYRYAPEENYLKHIALASGVYLLMDFAPSLFFVPPFYTSSKGLFYTFLEVFIVGMAAHLLVPQASGRPVAPRSYSNLTGSAGFRP